jgi:hypothetical protein
LEILVNSNNFFSIAYEEFLLSAYERVGLFFSSKFSKNNSGSKIPKGKYYLFLGQVKEDVNSTHFGLNNGFKYKMELEFLNVSINQHLTTG